MMENEDTEMIDLAPDIPDEEEDSDIAETIFTTDNGETFISFNKEKIERKKRLNNIKHIEDFFENILGLEENCSNPDFINFLLDRKIININREFSVSGLVNDYKVKYLDGEFKTYGRAVTAEELELLRGYVRGDYDDYSKGKERRKIKKAGIITGIGLSIAALITGLSVGLIRKGNDMIHEKKLLPSTDDKDSSIWKELEKAAGEILVFTGRYLTLILIGAGIYLVVRKKSTVR